MGLFESAFLGEIINRQENCNAYLRNLILNQGAGIIQVLFKLDYCSEMLQCGPWSSNSVFI